MNSMVMFAHKIRITRNPHAPGNMPSHPTGNPYSGSTDKTHTSFSFIFLIPIIINGISNHLYYNLLRNIKKTAQSNERFFGSGNQIANLVFFM